MDNGPTTQVSQIRQATYSSMPAFIKYGGALLIIGLAAQLLFRVSPQAGYGFALLVIFGFAASGGRADKVEGFFRNQFGTSGTKG
jgi:hypothetical protein